MTGFLNVWKKRGFFHAHDSLQVLYQSDAMSNPKIIFKFAHKVFALYRPLFKMIRQENENDNTTVPRTAHQQFLYMHALALDSRVSWGDLQEFKDGTNIFHYILFKQIVKQTFKIKSISTHCILFLILLQLISHTHTMCLDHLLVLQIFWWKGTEKGGTYAQKLLF